MGRTSRQLMAEILSVTELTSLVKDLIEGSLPPVWVAGEIADLARPQSGHYYLTLKNPGAQIPAVVWRSTAARVPLQTARRAGSPLPRPPGGLRAAGPLSVDRRGNPAAGHRGVGAGPAPAPRAPGARGALRSRPQAAAPPFPRRIAVVTSPTGAALQDFLEILRRRFRGVDVLVVPCRVQGEGAAEEIAAAIALANRLTVPIDCLVVTRGGGSLEDLWAFNEEVVVRAICASRIPVISGVGHEIDVTLADLAADVRALTPSDAAARVVPAAEELTRQLQQFHGRLTGAMRSRCAALRSRLETVAGHRVFSRPLGWVRDFARRVDEVESRLFPSVRQSLRQAGQAVEALAGRLDSLSPLAVLGRGYSLTQRMGDDRVVRDAGDLSIGESIRTRFAQGQAVSRVTETQPE